MDTAGDRVALLVIRVWVESGSDQPALRSRLTAIEDLRASGSEATVAVASEIDEICEHVRSWLAVFLAGGADTPPTSGQR